MIKDRKYFYYIICIILFLKFVIPIESIDDFINITTNITNDTNNSFPLNVTINSSYIKKEFHQIEKINYFLFTLASEFCATKYTKIQLDNKNDTNYVISYYHNDSTFSERKQLSYGTNKDELLIWLKKAQIIDSFYLSIECEQIPCDYTLEILSTNSSELNINDNYIYYVTKENIKMSFDFQINSITNKGKGNNTILIWVKGNNNIESKLNTSFYYEKHSKYNYYLIKYEKNSNYLLNLKIKGKERDLINVGSLFFDGTENSNCYKNFGNKVEITGFLKKYFKEKNCFKFSFNSDKIIFYQKVVYDSKKIETKFVDKNNFCVEIPNDYDEVVYSISILPKENNNNQNLYPLINNLDYYTEINKSSTIGLIPMNLNEDNNYITYYINPIIGKYNIGIYQCETYPLCSNYSLKNYEPIEYLNSFSISYYKNEIEKNLTNISHKKKIIIIKSEDDLNKNRDNSKNKLYINSHNEGYITFLKPGVLYAKYNKRENYENFIINHKNDENIYIFIEELSGNIFVEDFKPTNKKLYKYENKRLFIVKQNANSTYTNISFKISPSTDSFYKIIYIKSKMENNNRAFKLNMKDGNYLFNLRNKTLEIDLEKFDNLESLISLYPINCSLNVALNNDRYDKKNIFLQKIIKKNASFIINKQENIGNSTCLFSLSIFNFISYNSNNLNGIILPKNYSQSFIFNEKKTFNYLYLFTNTDESIFIEIKLMDNEKYELYYIIKNNINTFNITSNSSKEIDAASLKELCISKNQICHLSFSVKSFQTLEESKIEISISNTNNYQNEGTGNTIEKDDDKFLSLKNPLFMITIVGCTLFILIIIVIIIIITFNYKNKDMKENIYKISFSVDGKDTTESMEETDKDNYKQRYGSMLESEEESD